jgi:hypothetical protein
MRASQHPAAVGQVSPRGQTRLASAGEALTGTATGFALSVLQQQQLFPLIGLSASLTDNLMISAAFTLLSVIRSYLVRRLVNWIGSGLQGPGQGLRG